MATIIGIVVAALSGLSYSRKGLFAGWTALLSVFLAVLAALGFAGVIVQAIAIESPYAYALTMLGVALFVMIIMRGILIFVDDDVDFHPAVERVGGAIAGAASGALVVGFVCVLLMCMPFPNFLRTQQANAERVADLVLVPCRTTARLLPGTDRFELDTLRAAGGSKFCPVIPHATNPFNAPVDGTSVDTENRESSGT